MGKVHGSLTRAGKVRGQTPKVEKQVKQRRHVGKCNMRYRFNRRVMLEKGLRRRAKLKLNTQDLQNRRKEFKSLQAQKIKEKLEQKKMLRGQ